MSFGSHLPGRHNGEGPKTSRERDGGGCVTFYELARSNFLALRVGRNGNQDREPAMARPYLFCQAGFEFFDHTGQLSGALLHEGSRGVWRDAGNLHPARR